VTGADTTSLFVCSGADQRPDFVLHEGALSPVPELETEAQAAQLAMRVLYSEADHQRRAAQPLLYFQHSSAAGGYLLGLDIARIQAVIADTRPVAPDQCRRPSALPSDSAEQQFLWVGLRYNSGSSQARFIADHFKRVEAFICEMPDCGEDWMLWTLTLGGYLAWESYQLSALHQDHVSQLAGRAEFQACLESEHEKAVRERYPLALLLVNPDEFGLTNHRLGRQTGDAALREVALRLSHNLRRSDGVFRYGGAVFCILMPGTMPDAARAAADKLRQTLSKHGYLDGGARFAFSTGVAVYEPGDDVEADVLAEPGELLRRADQALNVAKLSGGSRTVVWSRDGNDSGIDTLDRLSGIFTADTEKDYRNMLLLWDTITVISSRPEMQAIAAEFVTRVGSTFGPERVSLYTGLKDDQPRLLAADCAKADGEGRISDPRELPLSSEQKSLMAMARRHKRTERLRLAVNRQGNASAASHGKAHIAYAVPLLVGDDCVGCLYLQGPEETLALDNSDLVFLDALASQIAVVLDRAELASRWRREKERESQRLREEVNELRQAMPHSRLVYKSSQLDAVVKTLGKVAPTDVTVLISGESGTGKEMLARTLHDLSARRKRPFITVDCSAIAHSLMDTELFGHVKGAYTGAQGSSPGRIIQAEAGTLFLDEVGELPLEIQAKLLRFLQEKEITPVGATRPINVDVRIVAATNRKLADEVARGRFREDLYYRLQVVTVTAPALRDRPDDILLLACYFLEKYSSEYGKDLRSLDPAAEHLLMDYPWPGNVRELQHRILQAVVMSDNEIIGSSELSLPAAATVQMGETAHHSLPQYGSAASLPECSAAGSNAPALPAMGNESPWATLREVLKRQLVATLDNSGVPVPLGRWLAEDLVLAADSTANNTARRACSALGMAETTFRRRLEKVKREFRAGLNARSEEWAAVQPVLSHLVTANLGSAGENIFDRARQVLLEEVVARVQQDSVLGSALMGVTAPTYRRWTAALHS
jgi:diguanylate cyclase (GGDEF)-like protein